MRSAILLFLQNKKLKKIAFSLLVFFLPTQLAVHFWPRWAFVYGIRVDYLSPAVYFTDLLLVFFLLLNIREIFLRVKKYPVFFCVFLLLAFLNIVFSFLPLLALYKWVRVLALIFFGLLAAELKLPRKMLFLSTALVVLVGVGQMFLGKTTGLFYLLGERTFTSSTPGIALVNLFGKELLRPYSVFPHPNAMAGYLLVIFWVAVLARRRSLLSWTTAGFCLVGIAVSFSQGAWIALAVSSIVYAAKKRRMVWLYLPSILVLSLFLPMGGFWGERGILYKTAGEIFSLSPIFGVGLGGFTASVPTLSRNVWLLQPVHNVFLLVLAETGALGLLAFWIVISLAVGKALKEDNYKFIALLVVVLTTGLVDHYWLTLEQTQFIFAYILGVGYARFKSLQRRGSKR